MLEKKKKTVTVDLYSKNITYLLKQDVKKFYEQHGNVTIKELRTFHDRFIIIDMETIYHFGASLKDTGKKVFAFSKLSIDVNDLLKKLM